jgi:hypothetical protein
MLIYQCILIGKVIAKNAQDLYKLYVSRDGILGEFYIYIYIYIYIIMYVSIFMYVCMYACICI